MKCIKRGQLFTGADTRVRACLKYRRRLRLHRPNRHLRLHRTVKRNLGLRNQSLAGKISHARPARHSPQSLLRPRPRGEVPARVSLEVGAPRVPTKRKKGMSE